MSDVQHDEDSNSISHSNSSELDELENCYESNDTDSLNLEDDEEENEGSSFSIQRLSDRLVGGGLVLHIDQTGPPTSTPSSYIDRGADQSVSTTTSLSDTASDNISTRAVMGDTPSTTETNAFPPGDDDAADNSSQASMADSEADRVRRIHNSIFSSLEHDLAELVRIREETIQFLEAGVRSAHLSGENLRASLMSPNGNGDGDPGRVTEGNEPFALRERLTYLTRPATSGETTQEHSNGDSSGNTAEGTKAKCISALMAQTYTPVAKFDNAPPGLPAKPYVEAGLAGCDEKAAAARKILDKLQYGDPEDEAACFVRRFWRETSTVVDNGPNAPLSLDVAAIAQRTASLQASLEEAFDGLRLRLQQAQAEATTPRDENSNAAGERNDGESENENVGNSQTTESSHSPEDNRLYQNWDEETSIMNNPLNYDIWNELEEGNEAGPTITARINMAERRAQATRRTRQLSPRPAINSLQRPVTTTVGVGTDNGNRIEGSQLDDDSTDDEEMMSYFRGRCNEISNSNNNDRPSILPRTYGEDSSAFFQEIGISEEMRRDLLNMFTFSEEEVRLPSQLTDDNDGINSSEMPEPLYYRSTNNNLSASENTVSSTLNDTVESSGNEVDGENENSDPDPPQIPLVDTTACISIAPNREDECSTRVYLDENYLNFPVIMEDNTHNQDH